MPSVCVVGGGPAGIAAATEASLNGAKTTLVESAQHFNPPRSAWHRLIRSGPRPDPGRDPVLPGVEVHLGLRVRSVDSRVALAEGGSLIRSDSVVLATGSVPLVPDLPGRAKPGFFLLDSPDAYRELGSWERTKPVVAGAGSEVLRVAEMLSGPGVSLTALTDLDGLPLDGLPRTLVLRAAADRGVQLLNAKLERAAGVGRVEAVSAGGKVVACDCVAFVPKFVPEVPFIRGSTGTRGGVLVDEFLRTPADGVLAAGSCAEQRRDRGAASLGDAPGTSGRVAGANATGLLLRFRGRSSGRVAAFGLQVVWAGLSLRSARSVGLDARAASSADDSSACTLVYEPDSGRVLGVQCVGGVDSPLTESVASAVDSASSMKALAYGQCPGSTDISLVSETARQGYKAWQRS